MPLPQLPALVTARRKRLVACANVLCGLGAERRACASMVLQFDRCFCDRRNGSRDCRCRPRRCCCCPLHRAARSDQGGVAMSQVGTWYYRIWRRPLGILRQEKHPTAEQSEHCRGEASSGINIATHSMASPEAGLACLESLRARAYRCQHSSVRSEAGPPESRYANRPVNLHNPAFRENVWLVAGCRYQYFISSDPSQAR